MSDAYRDLMDDCLKLCDRWKVPAGTRIGVARDMHTTIIREAAWAVLCEDHQDIAEEVLHKVWANGGKR